MSLIDLYPTLTEFCDLEAPDELDGKSLVPLLRDPRLSTGPASVRMFNPDNVSLRTDRWRHIRYMDGAEELYDHQGDPKDWDNLADSRQHSSQIEELRKMMSPFLKEK